MTIIGVLVETLTVLKSVGVALSGQFYLPVNMSFLLLKRR